MKKKIILKILFFSFMMNLINPLFSEDTTVKPYGKDEFPQFMSDIRRFEIITLGALPFVMLDTALVFSSIKYVQNDFDSRYFPSPFAASSYEWEEQKKIILTSMGICVGIGITDLIVQIVKRNNKKKNDLLTQEDIEIIKQTEQLNKTLINPIKENIEVLE